MAPEETTHFGRAVAIIFSTFQRPLSCVAVKSCVGGKCCVLQEGIVFSPPPFPLNQFRGSERRYFGHHRSKLLQSGVIVGYVAARCCYRQAPRCPLQFVLGSRVDRFLFLFVNGKSVHEFISYFY